MSLRKTITFLSRSAPYGSNKSQLCLEMALACAVFDQQVNYVFMDDGVYQLKKSQQAGVIGQKTLGNALEALALYDIDNAIVDSESLLSRAMEVADLVIPVTLASRPQIAALLHESDTVFTL